MSVAFGGGRTAYLDIDENGGNDVAKDLAKRDVELVKGDQVSTVLPSHGFGNIDRNCVEWMRCRFNLSIEVEPRYMKVRTCATLETNTEAKDYTTGDYHTEADGSCLKCCTNGV